MHDGDFLTSHSKDLSPDGMFVYTRKPLEVGDTTELTFSIGTLDEITVSAKVVWVNSSESETEAGMGVEFVNPPPFFQQTILETVNRVAFLGYGSKKIDN